MRSISYKNAFQLETQTEDAFERLYALDPELTEWTLMQEAGFGYAVAEGCLELAENTDPAHLPNHLPSHLNDYCRLVREAAKNGPTLGKIMATYLTPVFRHGKNGFLEHFLHTVDIMLTKGIYTLNRPLEAMAAILDAGDTASGDVYLNLLGQAFSHELSYNQSLHLSYNLPTAVLSFAPSKRLWQIEALRRVIKRDFRLAEPFLEGMEKGLHLLSEAALHDFVSSGLEKFQKNPGLGRNFLSLDSRLGIETYTEMLVTVSLSQVRQQLNRYLQARGTGLGVRGQEASRKSPLEWGAGGCFYGADIPPALLQRGSETSHLPRVRHSPCPPSKGDFDVSASDLPSVFSDGKFIYLPDEISLFESRTENVNLYKCLTKLESAYYEFRTFDFDLEKVIDSLADVQKANLPPSLQGRGTGGVRFGDAEQFFRVFPMPSLAADLFTIFEQGRIRKMLNRFYPGIVRQAFPLLQNEARRIFREEETLAPVFFLYEATVLGMSHDAELFSLSHAVKEEIERIAELFETMIEAMPLVETAAELVFRVYGDMENLIDKNDYKPLKTPFGWKFRHDLFFSVFRDIEESAETIKKRLEAKGIKAYKSDIKKHLIEKNGGISAEDIQKIVQCRTQNSDGEAGQVSISLESLREILGTAEMPHLEIQMPDEANVFWHKEWDCRLGDYLQDHVRVLDKFINGVESDFYLSVLNRRRGLVKQIRHAFELLKPEGITLLRQWIEGDEFDYRALLDFAIDKKAGVTPSERLYIKRLKQQRDVAVLLLTDLSRSTANLVPGTQSSVLDIEKEAIVLFCEALVVVGDAFAVAGFSGTGRLGADYFRIKDFDEEMSDAVKARINAMSPQRSTRMGAAIRHAAFRLEKVPAKVRLLLILSDGFPNDADYKREYAIEDTRRAIFEAQAKNIHARAITVNLVGDAKLDELYGALHHNVISDVRELPDKLLRIYSSLTR
ncbi:MAG: hypothetical protein BWK80_32675 [Desulfobacteraceae bacterium IS3]|nr:MAG: hypothetical protein BWK80_32675 [Desulfobacteraceae bacterium IS3]